MHRRAFVIGLLLTACSLSRAWPAPDGAMPGMDAGQSDARVVMVDSGPPDGGPPPDSGPCQPGAVEACNGRDDTCDGNIDETFTCVLGATQTCRTTCNNGDGMQTCIAGCAWGACTPPAETCDGDDNDCDGTADNGFDCAMGDAGVCTTTCGTAGTRTCTATCEWPACVGTASDNNCNGIDEDCDGTIDSDAGCPCNFVTRGGHSYLFCENDHSWTVSETDCLSHGYHLVTVNDAGEASFLATQAEIFDAAHVWWIGGHQPTGGSDWEWVANMHHFAASMGAPLASSEFVFWEPMEPSNNDCGPTSREDCIEMYGDRSGTWNDQCCSDSHNYICETGP